LTSLDDCGKRYVLSVAGHRSSEQLLNLRARRGYARRRAGADLGYPLKFFRNSQGDGEVGRKIFKKSPCLPASLFNFPPERGCKMREFLRALTRHALASVTPSGRFVER
jgi:hypothetical protein